MADDKTAAPTNQPPIVAAPKPAARQTVVVKPSKSAPTPFAFRETKLREGMVETIKNLKPEGAPDLAQLENIRAYILSEISALPDDVNAVEVVIESNVTSGSRRVHVIVFPKKL